MSFVVQYAPDPRTLGAYALESARAPAIRDNLSRAAQLRQNDAQFIASQAQHNRDQVMSAYQNAQNNQSDLQKQQMQQEGYALKNQYELQKAQEANAADLQQEQMRQQGMRAQAYDRSVQQGLKDGSLYYSPQQKQQLAESQRNIASIAADTSISPDQQDAMIARHQQAIRSIVPLARSEDERPVPFHERAGNDIAVWTKEGQLVPLSQLGRPQQEGDIIVTGTQRNGAMSYKTTPYKGNDQSWSSQPFVSENRTKVAKSLLDEKNARFDRELKVWTARNEAHQKVLAKLTDALPAEKETLRKQAEALDPGPPNLNIPVVTDDEIESQLYRMSGGQAGREMPPVMPQMPVPVQGWQQPQYAEDGRRLPAPNMQGARTMEYRPWRDGPATPVPIPNHDPSKPSRIQFLGGSNANVVVVNSPEDVMALPPGTKFITRDGKRSGTKK